MTRDRAAGRLSKLQRKVLELALAAHETDVSNTPFGDHVKPGEYSGLRCLKIENLARALYGVTSEHALRWERYWGDYVADATDNITDRRRYNAAMASLSRLVRALVRRGLLKRVAITGIMGNVSRPIWLHITEAGTAVAKTVKQTDAADCLTVSLPASSGEVRP